MADSIIEEIQEADAAREGFPGEHWLVLAAGVGAWWLTRNHPSWVVRTGGLFAASALVARAASGRDGLARALRYTPFGGRIPRPIRRHDPSLSWIERERP